ncbi:MAG: ATP-binding protein [Leptolyngbyaceae cyanobacterium RM2_2_21]|nr:ATP-binding protein [Leptolyngbyaceae cyanobacterium RM2_2_21]
MTEPTPPAPTIPISLSPYESLNIHLKSLKLSHMLNHWQRLEQQATQEHWSYAQFLLALSELEATRRYQARIQRAISESQLPHGKALSNFEFAHCPSLNPASVTGLAQEMSWINQGGNCLIFGPSGTGKTHLAAGIARSTVELGKRVKFFSATALVQILQQAKLNLNLPGMLSKLDRYDLLVVDDLGYVKKSEAETSVLFELIAHRYERKSLMITANQPFRDWDSIFADSMMTVAAIDRLVHHAVILEIQAESYRQQAALKQAQAAKTARPEVKE